MDKKKVKEHIQRALVWIDPMTTESANYETAIKMAAKNLEFAMKELSKSDWVSVEDGLPEYGESVWVRAEDVAGAHYFQSERCRTNDKLSILNYDKHDFDIISSIQHVTHWRKIEKLEE